MTGRRPRTTARGPRSRLRRSERSGNLIDGRDFGGAHLLALLPMRGRDLVGEGEDEAPVLVELFGRRLALQQRRCAPQMPESGVSKVVAVDIDEALRIREELAA